MLLAAASLLAALLVPLATYALTLATFGLVHVFSEFRYVDERFGFRIGARHAALFALLLAGVVLLRVLGVAGEPASPLLRIELWLVVALVLVVLPTAVRHGLLPGALVLAAGGILAVAALWWPLATLVTLAFLHNLTPVGFLAERLSGATRRRTLALAALAFGMVPLLIAAGVFEPLATLVGSTGTAPFVSGGVARHAGAFVPAYVEDPRLVARLFSAAAFLQCLHYIAVIRVLPRLQARDAPVCRLPWPRRQVFTAFLVVLAGLGLVGFALDFDKARQHYGVLAAVHAWIELPILLLAPVLLQRGGTPAP